MKEFLNFFGHPEQVPEDLIKMLTASPVVSTLRLIDQETGIHRSAEGTIEVHQRGLPCLALNSHEPRPFIVCWHSGGGYTDISFHREMGGEHGALHAVRRMFERYTERKA